MNRNKHRCFKGKIENETMTAVADSQFSKKHLNRENSKL